MDSDSDSGFWILILILDSGVPGGCLEGPWGPLEVPGRSLEGHWEVLEGPWGGPWRSLRVPGDPWRSLAGPSGSPNALFSNESIGSLGVLVVSQEIPGRSLGSPRITTCFVFQ